MEQYIASMKVSDTQKVTDTFNSLFNNVAKIGQSLGLAIGMWPLMIMVAIVGVVVVLPMMRRAMKRDKNESRSKYDDA